MFNEEEQQKSSTSTSQRVFVTFLILVLMGAVWVLADQRATFERVAEALQRNVTTEGQLNYQCRNLENEKGQARCEQALDQVRTALDKYEGQLQEAR